jgi:hypothetical protein
MYYCRTCLCRWPNMLCRWLLVLLLFISGGVVIRYNVSWNLHESIFSDTAAREAPLGFV